MPISSQSVKISPIYNEYFSTDPAPNLDWNKFISSEQELLEAPGKTGIDFSVCEENYKPRSKAYWIGITLLQIIILPYGLYKLTRYIVQRFIMTALYPAQTSSFKLLYSSRMSQKFIETIKKIKPYGFVIRHVALEKNGVRYSGLLFGHPDSIHNGNWVIQAGGNCETMHGHALEIANEYSNTINPQKSINILYVDGPSVGLSEGLATPETIGDAQEVGICFLEEAIKAKKIIIGGLSLGGAAMARAIANHRFKPDVKYLVVSQMTFSSVSMAASEIEIFGQMFKIFKVCIRALVKWSGCEIDVVAGARRLDQLGIKHIIVQATNRTFRPHSTRSNPSSIQKIPTADDFVGDNIISAQATLGRALIENNITNHTHIYGLAYADHNDSLSLIVSLEEQRKFCLDNT